MRALIGRLLLWFIRGTPQVKEFQRWCRMPYEEFSAEARRHFPAESRYPDDALVENEQQA